MSKPVILTGLRANGEFHIGNYLGGILPMVELQKKHAADYQINMFVPDLHSFTTPIDHSQLYQQTLDNLRVYMAAGVDIDNGNTYIYRQSYISAHSELQWILSCFAYFGELSRMTQFKEKSEGKDNVSAGLFNYPVLMAADILLYGATWIPVGEDQMQHIELARDIALRVNNKFEQELFVVPKPWKDQLKFANRDAGVRIRSLRSPEKKMSKSVSDPAGTLMLSDSPQEAAKKVMSATTDSVGAVHLNWENQPGVSNLLQMAALISERSLADVAQEWEGKSSYGDLKKYVADVVAAFLTDFQARYTDVSADALISKLEQSETAMRDSTQQTLHRVQQAVGLRSRTDQI